MQEPRFNAIDADTVELISDQGGSHRGRRDLKVRNLMVDGTETIATQVVTTSTITTAAITTVALTTATVTKLVAYGVYTPIVGVSVANYTVLPTDFTLLCDTTSNTVTLALPPVAGEVGRTLEIKHVTNNATAVILDPSGAETIEGASSLSITSFATTYTIKAHGTGWFIVSAY